MASYIGSAAVASATASLPSPRQVYDLEVFLAYRNGSATPPSLPSGCVSLLSGGANTNAALFAYRWCFTAADSAPVFTNATQVDCAIYRGVLGVGAISALSSASSSTVNYPALTLADASGASWISGFAGHRTASNVNVPPTGMTNRTSVGTGPMSALHDSNGGLSSWSSQNVTVNASSGHESGTGELLTYSAWNPFDIGTGAAFTFSSGNKTVTCSASVGAGSYVRGTFPRFTGRRVFAITPTFNGDDFEFGIADASVALPPPSGLGQDTHSASFFNVTGVGFVWQYNAGNTTLSASTLGNTTKCYVAIDFDALKVWIKAAGWTNWNNDAGADPDSGTNGLSIAGFSGTNGIYPVVGIATNADAAVYSGSDTGSGLKTFLPWDATGVLGSTLIAPQAVKRSRFF